MATLAATLRQVAACRICEASLPLGPRPVIQVHRSARILIASQAPGRRVHSSGIPFDDASGDRLREWMGISRDTFYDRTTVAILPMGFCYPGTGPRGDRPPRPECAPAWRPALLAHLPHVELVLLVGRYAQTYHLAQNGGSVTACVREWRTHGPRHLPLPHPSPRNQRWMASNPWFTTEVLPALRRRVRELTSS